MASDGDCKNIMNGNFTEVGLARIENCWVQVFAAPRSDGKPQLVTAVGLLAR